MTLNEAFAKRVRELLNQKGMTQYKLEQATGLYHSTLTYILNKNDKTKSCNFRTMALIIQALGLSLTEFFDSDYFDFENLEIEEK